jgi:DNA-binding MltR family transcriptional regulator
MESLKDPAEEIAFYNHDSNRAVGVVWPAIVENRLTDAIRASLRPDKKVADEMFSPSGALGTFGQKIRLGYMLGLYQSDLRDDLTQLSKIRNAFAHQVDITSFEESPVKDRMDAMRIVAVNRELLNSLRSDKAKGEKVNSTKLFVLEQEFSDYRNTFHLCVRSMIHILVRAETRRLAASQEAQRRVDALDKTQT